MSRQSTQEIKTMNSPAEPAGLEAQRESVRLLAYQHWLDRGCPAGSSEEDWLLAEEELRKTAKTVQRAA